MTSATNSSCRRRRHPVQPQISIPIDTAGILISADGNVSIEQFGQTQFSQVGQLQMAKFLNPEGLIKLGENLYQETLASGACVFGQPGTNGLGTLRQKALERSNVDFDEETLGVANDATRAEMPGALAGHLGPLALCHGFFLG